MSVPLPAVDDDLLFAGVRTATPASVIVRTAADAALLVVGVAATAWAATWFAGSWLLLALIGAACLWTAARTGRTPASHLLALRTVDANDACPPGAMRALFPVGTVTADLRRGRDPLAAPLAAASASEVETAAVDGPDAPSARSAARRPVGPAETVRHAPLALVLDSGQHIVLAQTAVIGRSPADLPAETKAIAWPDLSRTLSKSHARLEWDGAVLWVTDLGSTNGSFYRVGEAQHPLLPFARTDVPLDAIVEMGDRTLTVARPAGAVERR